MEGCVVKLRLRDNESVGDAVKRFRKLVEHAGIKKEMRRREFYEKPSETNRRSRRRAERRAKIQRMVGGSSGASGGGMGGGMGGGGVGGA
jgi:small subunit ribosomal protein S21